MFSKRCVVTGFGVFEAKGLSAMLIELLIYIFPIKGPVRAMHLVTLGFSEGTVFTIWKLATLCDFQHS